MAEQPIFRVFVSSTYLDLRDERDAVEHMLHRFKEIKFIGMEYFGSRSETTKQASLEDVDFCQIYIGIFGYRYGSGITEAEYRRASELQLPCLLYVKTEDHPGLRETKLREFCIEVHGQHTVSEYSSSLELAGRIAADLHHWIMKKVVSPMAASADQGQLSIPEISGLVTAMRLLASLGRPAAEDNNMASAASLVYRLFQQAPSLLTDHIRTRQFETLIEERTRLFVGRDYVFDGIDTILANTDTDEPFPSGYILIKGEPGIGKTSLAAQLVKTRGYLHHFNIALQNIRSTEVFLRNICAQLIVTYGLDYPSLPSGSFQDGGFLRRLLSEAIHKRPEEQLIIVVDSLDEAEDVSDPNANKLLLPADLPDNVYFILTTRPKLAYRLVVDNRRDIDIDENDPHNKADIKRYIQQALGTDGERLARKLTAWQIEKETVIDILVDKSQGNFMYIVYVLKDLLNGRLNPDNLADIAKLPVGLKEYYARHWRLMKDLDSQRFSDYYEPVVCVLATVPEPVTIPQVIEWCGRVWPQLKDAAVIRDVIQEWRPFLDEDTASRPAAYRLYHFSFKEFLEEKVGLAYYHQIIALNTLFKIPNFMP